jgi:integrase
MGVGNRLCESQVLGYRITCQPFVSNPMRLARLRRQSGRTDNALGECWKFGCLRRCLPPESVSAHPVSDASHHSFAPSEEGPSLEAAWDQFEKKEKERDLSTATIYKNGLLRRQKEAFAARRGLRFLQKFTLDVLEMFQSEWREGAVTRSKRLERLKAFLRSATARAGIDDNPSLLLKGPKVEPNPTRPFTKAEMNRILAAIERYPDKSRRFGRPNALRLRAFVLTLRYSGLRIGDVTSLHVERLDGSKIFLYSQKTGVPVYCVLPPFVAEALATVPRLSENYFFWTGTSKLHTAVGTWQR